MNIRPALLLLPLLLLAPNCGGAPKDRTVEIVITFPPLGTESGFITRAGATFTVSKGEVISVGDDANNDFVRGFVRFDLTAMPANAVVINAVLRMNQESTAGAPYAALGEIQVDHLDMGPGLDETDWDDHALGLQIGTLSVDATLGTKSLNVAPELSLDEVDGRLTSDFRFLFAALTDSDDTADQAIFTKPGQLLQPALEVTVRVPGP